MSTTIFWIGIGVLLVMLMVILIRTKKKRPVEEYQKMPVELDDKAEEEDKQS